VRRGAPGTASSRRTPGSPGRRRRRCDFIGPSRAHRDMGDKISAGAAAGGLASVQAERAVTDRRDRRFASQRLAVAIKRIRCGAAHEVVSDPATCRGMNRLSASTVRSPPSVLDAISPGPSHRDAGVRGQHGNAVWPAAGLLMPAPSSKAHRGRPAPDFGTSSASNGAARSRSACGYQVPHDRVPLRGRSSISGDEHATSGRASRDGTADGSTLSNAASRRGRRAAPLSQDAIAR